FDARYLRQGQGGLWRSGAIHDDRQASGRCAEDQFAGARLSGTARIGEQCMTPDLVLINGNIRTMDPLKPVVTALAARRGRIVALGSTAEIKPLAGKATRIVDAGGRLVLPGFQDTHIHLQDSGTRHALDVDLASARTVPELQEMLGRFAKS